MTGKVEVFADTLMSATVCDGVIRLEFGTFEGSGKEGTEEGRRDSRDATPSHRLLMPLPGFMRSLRVMQEVLKRMEEEKSRRAGSSETGDSRNDGAGGTVDQQIISSRIPFS